MGVEMPLVDRRIGGEEVEIGFAFRILHPAGFRGGYDDGKGMIIMGAESQIQIDIVLGLHGRPPFFDPVPKTGPDRYTPFASVLPLSVYTAYEKGARDKKRINTNNIYNY
jgi:hypothetical protein